MKHLFLLLTLSVLLGCQSKQTVVLEPARAGQAVAARQNLAAGPAAGVGTLRQPETVKVYGINR